MSSFHLIKNKERSESEIRWLKIKMILFVNFSFCHRLFIFLPCNPITPQKGLSPNNLFPWCHIILENVTEPIRNETFSRLLSRLWPAVPPSQYFKQNWPRSQWSILFLFFVAAHINHIRSVAGVDCVGLGAGYDGINLCVFCRAASLSLKFMYCSAFQYSAGTGRRFSVPGFICRAHSHRPVDGRRVEAAGWAQLFEGHRERGKCERTQKMNYPSAAQVRPIIRGLSASLAGELHAPLVPSRFFFLLHQFPWLRPAACSESRWKLLFYVNRRLKNYLAASKWQQNYTIYTHPRVTVILLGRVIVEFNGGIYNILNFLASSVLKKNSLETTQR